MKLSNIVFAGGLLAGMVFGGNTARADFDPPSGSAVVNWHPETSFIHGTGCNGSVGPNQDAWIIANGQDLSLVFSAMGIALPGGGTVNDLSQQKSCAVRIPVEIARGFYIGELTQTITVGVTKSDNVDIDGAAQSTFFGLPITSAHVHAAKGPGTEMNFAQLSATVADQFSVVSNPFFCPIQHPGSPPPAGLKGLFKSNLAVSGVRGTKDDNLLVSVDSFDLRWDILASIRTCPLTPTP